MVKLVKRCSASTSECVKRSFVVMMDGGIKRDT